MSKKLGLIVVLVLSLMVGAVAVQAADDSPLIPSFNDGRLNAFDAGAPLILYYTHDTVAAVDDIGLPTEYEVFSGIDVLRWDTTTESSSLVMNVTAEELKDAIASAKEDTVIAEVNGVSLNYSASGWLWLTSAPDSEGKVYSFGWEQDF